MFSSLHCSGFTEPALITDLVSCPLEVFRRQGMTSFQLVVYIVLQKSSVLQIRMDLVDTAVSLDFERRSVGFHSLVGIL